MFFLKMDFLRVGCFFRKWIFSKFQWNSLKISEFSVIFSEIAVLFTGNWPHFQWFSVFSGVPRQSRNVRFHGYRATEWPFGPLWPKLAKWPEIPVLRTGNLAKWPEMTRRVPKDPICPLGPRKPENRWFSGSKGSHVETRSRSQKQWFSVFFSVFLQSLLASKRP